MSRLDDAIELTGEDRWAWGRNGEIRRPSFVTVQDMDRDEVWISVYANRHTMENGASPIDLHVSKDDARRLGQALLAAAAHAEAPRIGHPFLALGTEEWGAQCNYGFPENRCNYPPEAHP